MTGDTETMKLFSNLPRDDSAQLVCTLPCPVKTSGDCSGRIVALYSVEEETSLDLFAATEDNLIFVWRHVWTDSLQKWEFLNQPALTMASTISSISCCRLTCDNLTYHVVLAAADVSGRVCLWTRQSAGGFQLVDSICLPSSQIVNSIHLTAIQQQTALLGILGSVDGRLYVYVADAVRVLSSSTGALFSQPNGSGFLPGHEDWVTNLTSIALADNQVMLASSSQDCKIRLWRLKVTSTSSFSEEKDTIAAPHTFIDIAGFEQELDEENIDDNDEAPRPPPSDVEDEECRLHIHTESGVSVKCFLEALLVGHEDWVTSVHWMSDPESPASELRLFSTSMDRNMLIWDCESRIPVARMGDVGGALGGSIGNNLLGFVAGCVNPDGRSILGIGYGGSFHWWVCTGSPGADMRWQPRPFLTGHFSAVNDFVWSPEVDDGSGRLSLISVSSDQTCRVFCSIPKGDTGSGLPWAELSRPQVHGYDLSCIVSGRGDPHPYTIYTAGEEKIIRCFEAPEIVLQGLRELGGSACESSDQNANRIYQAYIPELGLSNKALETISKQEKSEMDARGVTSIDWQAPPLESQLADHTIWPETLKLFGHSTELICMAMSHCGTYIASGAKARDPATARILLWTNLEGKGRRLTSSLDGHDSTVVCMQFAPNDRYLVSSGKDRKICLFRRTGPLGGPTEPYVRTASVKNAHKRIVWDCCWTSDSRHIVSASRDGTCKIWRVSGDLASELPCIHTFSPFNGVAVTAVGLRAEASLESASISDGCILACGSETGSISLFILTIQGEAATAEAVACLALDSVFCHGAAVKRIKWTMQSAGSSNPHAHVFASCGEDHSIRVHRISLS